MQDPLTIELPGLTEADRPLELRLIQAGRFCMGQRGLSPDEEPVHKVQIPADFYMAVTPVTQKQYRVMAEQCRQELQAIEGNRGVNPSQFPNQGNGDNYPVDSVSWDDANVICQWLTQSGRLPSGWHASLPSEAHWEYACRAGTDTRYSFGDQDTALQNYGWFNGNSEGTTHPVGLKLPNPWGLYDLHGNVWEWCWDLYDPRVYRKRLEGAVATILENANFVERDSAPDWMPQLVSILERFANADSTGEGDGQRKFKAGETHVLGVYKQIAQDGAIANSAWQPHLEACREALRDEAWPVGQRAVAGRAFDLMRAWLQEYDYGLRVMRGGCWGSSPAVCRSAIRSWGTPGYRDRFQGFRVCLLPVPGSCPAAVGSETVAESEPGTGDVAWRDDIAKSQVRGGDGAAVDLSRSNLPPRSDEP